MEKLDFHRFWNYLTTETNYPIMSHNYRCISPVADPESGERGVRVPTYCQCTECTGLVQSLLYMTRNSPVGLTLAVTLVTMLDSVGSGIYTGGTNNIMILHVCVAVFHFHEMVNFFLVVDFR